MSKLEDVLARVETGETTAHDAAWLREQFALETIRRAVSVAPPPPQARPDPIGDVQRQVVEWLAARGVRDGWNDAQFAARMALWIQVELADLLELVQLPSLWFMSVYGPQAWTLRGAIEKTAALASMTLSRTDAWEEFGIDWDRPDECVGRLVELLVPVLAFSQMLGVDAIAEVAHRLERYEWPAVMARGGNGDGH